MKKEPVPETDFEARFLYDLRERLARESVCCPARRLLWDHLVQMLANFGPRKLAYGASTLGLGALAVGFLAMPGEDSAARVVAAKSPLTRLEHSLSALRSHSCQHATACTTIRICEQKKAPYTDASLASGGFSTPFEHASASSMQGSFPVQMGLEAQLPGLYTSPSSVHGF